MAPRLLRRLHRRIAVLLTLMALWVPHTAYAEPDTQTERNEQQQAQAPLSDEHSLEQAEESPDWWTPWYLVDYGLIAAGGTALFLGEEMTPTSEAVIGPAYNPNDPASFFASSGSQEVSEPFLDAKVGQTVPTEWVIGAIGGATLYLGALEGMAWADGTGSPQQFHDMMVGFFETTALTAGVTNLVKPSVGRLRPDFRDRALRYECTNGTPNGVDCDGYRSQPLSEDPEEAEAILLDGRRSFISGHSSNAFSVFAYTSLAIGGHYVWGEDATPRSRAAGIVSQSVLMATASFVAASRVMDGRHHPSDVLSGAAVGLAFANFSYWRRFGLDGNPRERDLDFGENWDVALELGPAPNGAGVQLTISH